MSVKAQPEGCHQPLYQASDYASLVHDAVRGTAYTIFNLPLHIARRRNFYRHLFLSELVSICILSRGHSAGAA
jgi:hypothetical protein